MSFITFLGRLVRFPAARQPPRVVRRVAIDCPHTGRPVEIDLLMTKTGPPEAVLRCSDHASCPPTCDRSCQACAEAVLTPARAVIITPPGQGPIQEID